MIPSEMVAWLESLSKHYDDRSKAVMMNAQRDVAHLDERREDNRKLVVNTTKQYVEDGWLDIRKLQGYNYLPPIEGRRRSVHITVLMKRIAKEMGRGWLTVSADSMRIPNLKRYQCLWLHLSLVMKPGKPTYGWVLNPETNRHVFESIASSPVLFERFDSYTLFRFSGDDGKALLNQTLERAHTDDQCRRVLRIGEYLYGNNGLGKKAA